METSQVTTQAPYTIKPGWISFLLGFLFILIGIWVLITPAESYLALSVIFSITFLVNGIFEIFSAASSQKSSNRGWVLAGGIFDLLLGIMLISNPLITAGILPFYVGFGLMFRSMMAIGVSFQFSGIKGWGWLLFLGIGGLIFSFMLLRNPVFAGMTIVTFTGLAFLVIGIFRLVLGFKFK
ncbi:HdeD family acid-resistance protein [Dyadobacter frigoris]|uniref:HdeD family acid-resistance protein n=1 Tax=Dyadobacter frigoris TaxID=2576211 RepID=A0A4V6BHH5_9BACT|nr:DUF308 domain-containing protein [Dyadobacter frigoris]TKT86233.1 HdeD family acid-resistance protein [Dyadobacter frigoris]GLU56927.1 membrane protein [Dyadobacter frigoris]